MTYVFGDFRLDPLREERLVDFYDYLYSLDYLRPQFALRWADKDLSQLSPGERGSLLLVFYLLLDNTDIPLVIDQPEGNLDNQTVFDILVPCIKRARGRRQVVIVTHNPNIAVVADADQVVYASLGKKDGNRGKQPATGSRPPASSFQPE